jgi:hypothetical protein
MDKLSDVELRVMLVACRQTFGWHREKAPLSISYLEAKTGKSKQGVRNGVMKSTKRSWLKKVGTGRRGVSIYGINFSDLSTELTVSSQPSREEHVKPVDTEKKVKDSKEKNILAGGEVGDSSDSSDSSHCEVCKHEYHYMSLLNGNPARVCNCMHPVESTCERRYFPESERKGGVIGEFVLKDEQPPPPTPPHGMGALENKNNPNNPPTTPIHEKPTQTGQTGTRFTIRQNGSDWEVVKTPIVKGDNQSKRLVTKMEVNPVGETTATKPANLKAEAVATTKVVPSPAPETAQEKRDKEIEQIANEMRRVGSQSETFGAICNVLGWDVATVPTKKKTRIGKAAKELIEISASIWKIDRMQRWAKSKYGDKWNFPFNLGSPEKVVDLWATYCGETESENSILVPEDPNVPLFYDDSEKVIAEEDRVSPEKIAEALEEIRQMARRKSIGYDPLTDTTSKERAANNE